MRTLTVELPDRVADQLEALVKDGWFPTEEEAVRTAVLDLLRDRRLGIEERHQLQDIAWAVAAHSAQR
jgi:Arc/MetJ-type ribon-helix-helix transcriptional regulator